MLHRSVQGFGRGFHQFAGGNNNKAQAFLSRGGQVIIRILGLPYKCTVKQVLDFFEVDENSSKVMANEEGILFVKKPDGCATGDALVLFSQDEDAGKALSKQRELIGCRYIELFYSTTAEVQQILQVSLLPQHFITSDTRKDCIRLCDLLYDAQVEHILEFLGVSLQTKLSSKWTLNRVHFIQCNKSVISAWFSARNSATTKCSIAPTKEDINMVSMGGIPTGPPVSPAKPISLLSPGGTILPSPPYCATAAFSRFGQAAMQLISPMPALPPPPRPTKLRHSLLLGGLLLLALPPCWCSPLFLPAFPAARTSTL
ncbi:hypothetical protein PR048_000471 [Dryococelus australis]|uniref:RRM domain-containing protein n=1 Tax=Dryococelus australis TaxID=614101 RepID=A0ABQ9IFL8_9NEOP|nr:hypothetical protein PR048_000471 [Dryococelus australis]